DGEQEEPIRLRPGTRAGALANQDPHGVGSRPDGHLDRRTGQLEVDGYASAAGATLAADWGTVMRQIAPRTQAGAGAGIHPESDSLQLEHTAGEVQDNLDRFLGLDRKIGQLQERVRGPERRGGAGGSRT